MLCPTNSEDIASLCCCCGMLPVLKSAGRPAEEIRSSFRATIDSGRCNGCAVCLDPRQIEAIVEADEAMAIDAARCLGCGLCVSSCPEGAISLAQRSQTEALAPNVARLLSEIGEPRADPRRSPCPLHEAAACHGFTGCQKGPVFPISLIVATISAAYCRLRETQSGSRRLRK